MTCFSDVRICFLGIYEIVTRVYWTLEGYRVMLFDQAALIELLLENKEKTYP